MLDRRTFMVAGLGSVVVAGPVRAALEVGERAPDFTIMAALAGNTFSLSLQAQLRQGPLVLYFFPAAFSEGCSLEARSFAAAIEHYQALGAGVVGVSGDDLETLRRFSVRACNGKFAVASDESQTVMKAYDAVMTSRPDYAGRVSYVLAPDRTVVFVYNNLNPDKHVEKTLAALRDWRSRPGNAAGR